MKKRSKKEKQSWIKYCKEYNKREVELRVKNFPNHYLPMIEY